jgi:hypothetical protein
MYEQIEERAGKRKSIVTCRKIESKRYKEKADE